MRIERALVTHRIHDASALGANGSAKAANPSDGSPFSRLLRALGHEVNQGESAMSRIAGSGAANLGAPELLALQVSVYRYSEAVDLSAKLIEKVATGAKTILQAQ